MCAARRDFLDGRFTRAHGVQPQRDIEVLCEAAREIVGGAYRALAAEVVGIGAVARYDPQLARIEDLQQQRRGLGAGREQQAASAATRILTGCPRPGRAGAWCPDAPAAIEYAAARCTPCAAVTGLRRGTEAVITAPTRNRMGA